VSFQIVLFSLLSVLEDGQLYLWGWNEHGNIGNGTNNNAPLPVPVSLEAGTTVNKLAMGGAAVLLCASTTTHCHEEVVME
jgi:alpha-tubulin suppressor-like RCC1 family protein